MSNLAKYNDVFKSVFNVQEEALNGNFSQDSVDNWDSISHLSLITSLEEQFNIMFDAEDILKLTSYEQGKEIMAKFEVVL
jgi:acyl carrier protein